MIPTYPKGPNYQYCTTHEIYLNYEDVRKHKKICDGPYTVCC